jgi:hypothetical protein
LTISSAPRVALIATTVVASVAIVLRAAALSAVRTLMLVGVLLS